MLELIQFVTFASTAAEAEEKSGIAVLGIDPKVILLQAGTFLLLFFILKKFALENIVKTLEQRRKTIDKGVELGLSMQAQKREFDEDLKKLHHQARAQADKIIAEAHQEAGTIIKDGEAAAAKKVDSMLADAQARIDREITSAREGLRNEMLALVSEATEVILEEKIDAQKDKGLIERALARVKG